MRRTTILNAKQVKRMSFSEAEQLFTKHCKLKNLSPQTMRYYTEDLKYFRHTFNRYLPPVSISVKCMT